MARPLKANPIPVDYQRDRHGARNTRRGAGKDDGHSGVFYLFVWALSTGLFLTAAYVAAEAPFADEATARRHHDKAVVGRAGLAMTPVRAPHLTADARAEARSETRR
jgi:hypothetical protein